MNIMLIDDDEAIRDMLQDIIEDYELGTVVASLPSAAKLTTAELVARHIDLLIIDMLMPDCDGIDSVRRFHDFPRQDHHDLASGQQGPHRQGL